MFNILNESKYTMCNADAVKTKALIQSCES